MEKTVAKTAVALWGLGVHAIALPQSHSFGDLVNLCLATTRIDFAECARFAASESGADWFSIERVFSIDPVRPHAPELAKIVVECDWDLAKCYKWDCDESNDEQFSYCDLVFECSYKDLSLPSC